MRKEAKTYGTCQLAEGGDIDGRRLTVVEDVVTSGGQVVISCGDLRDRGAMVEHAVCVIDRESRRPGRLADIGVELHPLFTMTELKPPANLPSWRASRRAGVSDAPKLLSRRRSPPGWGAGRGRSRRGAPRRRWPRTRCSTQRSIPASGHGRLSRPKKPTARVSSGWPLELAAEHAAVEQQRVQREAGEAEAQAVEHRDQRDRLHLDAGLLVDLLHRDLRRRVADVGVADRVQPHARVGALGEQELAALVADDGGDRDLRRDVARRRPRRRSASHSSNSVSASASSIAAARMSAATLSTSSNRSCS